MIAPAINSARNPYPGTNLTATLPAVTPGWPSRLSGLPRTLMARPACPPTWTSPSPTCEAVLSPSPLWPRIAAATFSANSACVSNHVEGHRDVARRGDAVARRRTRTRTSSRSSPCGSSAPPRPPPSRRSASRAADGDVRVHRRGAQVDVAATQAARMQPQSELAVSRRIRQPASPSMHRDQFLRDVVQIVRRPYTARRCSPRCSNRRRPGRTRGSGRPNRR